MSTNNDNLLAKGRIAVLGYGSQGRAHALNLRDSGLDVVVGLRPNGPTWHKAKAEGFTVVEPAEAVKGADLVAVLTPDMVQPTLYTESIAPNIKPGAALLFAHGFNVHFGQIAAPEGVDVFMVAPKGPGHLVRRVYTEGGGVPCLLAIQVDATGNAKNLGLAYAKAIGGTRAGVLETSFREETETDLFGEQAVLCGGVTHLMQAGFETLVEAGYDPEIAYFECVHEMKLIVDLIYEGGLERMRYSVSNTAEFGDYRTGPRIVTDATKAEMKRVLSDIRSGAFASDFLMENVTGQARLKAGRKATEAHLLTRTGARLRKMMSFIGGKR